MYVRERETERESVSVVMATFTDVRRCLVCNVHRPDHVCAAGHSSFQTSRYLVTPAQRKIKHNIPSVI